MKLSNNLSPEQLLQQSQSLQQSGKFKEAAIGFEKLRQLYPTYPPILNSLGIVYFQLGEFKEGCKLLEKSLQLDPRQAVVFYNLGRAYQNQGQFNDAIIAFKKALKIQPDFIDAYERLGVSLYNTGSLEEANQCFEDMVSASPQHPSGHNGKGLTLYAMGRYEAALISFKRALVINNNLPEIHNNIGLALHKLNRWDDAITHFNQALQLNPNHADAYSNRGLTLQALQKTNEAINDFNRCLEIAPDHADANWNKGIFKLSLGEYEEGWKLYEWRWKSFSKKWARHYNKPLWLGKESLEGKRILIYPEQGYGDFIQFYRYIPQLQALGAKVILETPAPLITLIADSSTDVEIIESVKRTPRFDFQCPIMSLPLAFKTNLNNIPTILPYLFIADEKNKKWEGKLGLKTKKRIGIAWSGSKEHKNDHNRSILLEKVTEILDLDYEFHSLQKEIRSSDKEVFSQSKIKDHSEELIDFSETGALISNMDLIISVDTAAAHLSGALDKNIFILLPFSSDYRWLINRPDSPWYRSVKLFRQSKVDVWDETLKHLKKEIIKALA